MFGNPPPDPDDHPHGPAQGPSLRKGGRGRGHLGRLVLPWGQHRDPPAGLGRHWVGRREDQGVSLGRRSFDPSNLLGQRNGMLLEEHDGVPHDEPSLSRTQGGDIDGLDPDCILAQGPGCLHRMGAGPFLP